MRTKLKRQDNIPKPAVEMKTGQRNIANIVQPPAPVPQLNITARLFLGHFLQTSHLRSRTSLKQQEQTSRSGTGQYKVHSINVAYLCSVSSIFVTASSGFPPLPTASCLPRAPLSLSRGGRTHQLSPTKEPGSFFFLPAKRTHLTGSCP